MFRIAQITDSHLVAEGRLWKDRRDTAARLRAVVEKLNAIAPDLVVFTGDLVDRGDGEDGAAQYANAVRILADLDAPLRLIPGNHDDRAAMRAAFPEQKVWLDPEFLHFAENIGPIRLIGLDSVDPGQVSGRFCAARLDWLFAAMESGDGRPTLIAMHHPPCAMGLDLMDRFAFVGGEALGDLLTGREEVLRILCGHVHCQVDAHWRGTLVSASPAVSVQLSPLLTGADGLSYSDWPPAIRLHDWRSGTGPGTGLTVKMLPVEVPGAGDPAPMDA